MDDAGGTLYLSRQTAVRLLVLFLRDANISEI